MEGGLQSFLGIAEIVAESGLSSHCRQILAECARRIQEFGAGRAEYPLLAVLVMERCAR